MTRRRLWIGAGLLVFLTSLLLLGGCAAEDVVKRAETAVKQAGSVHADYLAPYEFASAEQYLAEAKKQLNESDYQTATAYAQKAIDMAAKAQAIAQQRHAEPMIPWTADAPPPPPPVEEGGAQ